MYYHNNTTPFNYKYQMLMLFKHVDITRCNIITVTSPNSVQALRLHTSPNDYVTYNQIKSGIKYQVPFEKGFQVLLLRS